MGKDNNSDKHCGDCKYFGPQMERENFHICQNDKSIYKVCLPTATGCSEHAVKAR